MAEPFIHHLHIIHAQLNYTYLQLKAYLHLKSIKSIKILKTNKNTLNENWGLAPLNLNIAL